MTNKEKLLHSKTTRLIVINIFCDCVSIQDPYRSLQFCKLTRGPLKHNQIYAASCISAQKAVTLSFYRLLGRWPMREKSSWRTPQGGSQVTSWLDFILCGVSSASLSKGGTWPGLRMISVLVSLGLDSKQPKERPRCPEGHLSKETKIGRLLNKRGLFGHRSPERGLTVELEGLSAELKRRRRKQQQEKNHHRITHSNLPSLSEVPRDKI